MKIKNITKEERNIRVEGKIVLVLPGKIVEARKIVFDKNSFEKLEKIDLNLVKKTRKKKEDKE